MNPHTLRAFSCFRAGPLVVLFCFGLASQLSAVLTRLRRYELSQKLAWMAALSL
jgi:hypothetical protein